MKIKIAVLAAILATTGAAPQAATAKPKVSEQTLTDRAATAKATAEKTGSPLVTFDGGYYDATTKEVYIDQNARVAKLKTRKLVDQPLQADPVGKDGLPLATKAAASCPGAGPYTHCETVTCQSAKLWLNYVYDDFSREYLTVYRTWVIQIRNADGHGYRMVPPRGVRTYRGGRWAFISANCVSGGYSN